MPTSADMYVLCMSLFYILTIGFSAVLQEWGVVSKLSVGYRPNIFIMLYDVI